MRTLDQVAESCAENHRNRLGGFEPQYPNELFGTVYERARADSGFDDSACGRTAGAKRLGRDPYAPRVDRIGQPREPSRTPS